MREVLVFQKKKNCWLLLRSEGIGALNRFFFNPLKVNKGLLLFIEYVQAKLFPAWGLLEDWWFKRWVIS